MIDHYITTDISASIVDTLMARGWTLDRVAKTIDAPLSFVRGVQAQTHVLTMKDIKRLARQTGQTAELMVFNAFGPRSIKPELRGLFAATRTFLELSSSVRAEPARKRAKKRRDRTKAA